MVKEKFRIVIDGKPQRLYVNSSTKQRLSEPGDGIEGANEYPTKGDADKRAAMWGLKDYRVDSIMRDLGEITRLTEIGI